MRPRALRPDRALGADWIWPYWLERQHDPQFPAFVAGGTSAPPGNVTLRNWTSIGTVASGLQALVDPRGLLTPRRGGWSLDWWILGEDRWHMPSREAAVRQQLTDEVPVVETTMRIRGGDAVHRAYALPLPQPMAVVEITNRTTTPIAVVVSVRPYHPEGLASVERVELHGRTVRVDGRLAALFPKPPQGAAMSTFAEGDVMQRVLAEDTGGPFPADLRCPSGLATAAFVFPLAHTATLRFGVPLEDTMAPSRRRGNQRAQAPDVELGDDLPTSSDVVRSWQAQTTTRGLRLVVPEGRLASAIEANRRFLLAMHEGPEPVSSPVTSPDFSFGEASVELEALDLFGFHAESGEVVRGFPGRLRVDGRFLDHRGDDNATAAALLTMARHWRLTGALDDIDADAVIRSARWIERRRPDPERAADDCWSLRGLLDAAALLGALGEDRLAAECEKWAGRRADVAELALVVEAERIGRRAMPAGPAGRLDGRAIAGLAACAPLRVLTADHPFVVATADLVRERACAGAAVFGMRGHASGLDPSSTLQLAEVELAAGDRRCLDRLAWLVDAATETFTWPDLIHPGTGGGCGGDGHHGPTAAAFLRLVRHLLVREVDDGTLAVCSMIPDAWQGQNLEVHDAPTDLGKLSFALRWHDDRPALLWDLERRPDGGPVRITAPGLDPGWSTAEAKGEALLSRAPALRPPASEGSFT